MQKAKSECAVALELLNSAVKKLVYKPEQKLGITGSTCNKDQDKSWVSQGLLEVRARAKAGYHRVCLQ